MAFPAIDYMGLQKTDLLDICYQGSGFTICRVAKWAYMAIMVTEDTTQDEYEESRMTLACWHVDYEYVKRVMENNAYFAASLLSKQTGREPDLVTTITYDGPNAFKTILDEIKSGVRKPISDPQLDRLFMEHETNSLKVFLDKYGEDPKFSPKKVWPGMLMLLIYPLGLPFFYFNKPIWAYIMLATFVLGCIVPPALIAGGLLGCVLIVKLLMLVLGNKATDKDGLLICTKKDRELILSNIAKYKENVKKLEQSHE